MLASKVCRLPVNSFIIGLTRQPCVSTKSVQIVRIQGYATKQGGKGSFMSRAKARASLKERAMAPGGESAIGMGQYGLAGASAVGLGALAYYGLGLSKDIGAIEKSALWPPEVRKRVRDTYLYFGGSIALTAVSAVMVSRTPALMNLAMKRSLLAFGASIAAMIGSGMVVQSIPYKGGLGAKQLAWMVHCGVIGGVIAPVTLMGGPILVRAAVYTAGAVGALSMIAACAPSEKFLNMGGPLAMGLGVVLVSTLGGFFLPSTSALGAGLYSISIYGGAAIFGLFLLYDTQKIVKIAETYPVYAQRPFDPVNESVGIYLDTVNIFIRIAMMLGGNRRK